MVKHLLFMFFATNYKGLTIYCCSLRESYPIRGLSFTLTHFLTLTPSTNTGETLEQFTLEKFKLKIPYFKKLQGLDQCIHQVPRFKGKKSIY